DEGEMLPRKQDQQRMEQDYEMFLRDVEEDQDLRSTMALYKAQQEKKLRDQMEGVETASMADTEETEGDEVPKIDMDELLDEFEELDVADDQ
ncbi:MAG: hypothetical protein Q9177_006830, partial [Variospora cf. flavescens]